MSKFADELGHLKHHVMYPADRKAVIAACNQMSEATPEDSAWFVKALPEGKYNGPQDVLNALLRTV